MATLDNWHEIICENALQCGQGYYCRFPCYQAWAYCLDKYGTIPNCSEQLWLLQFQHDLEKW